MKGDGTHFKVLDLSAKNPSSAWAGTPALEGVVKDPTGHPIKGADVRIEAKNGGNFSRIVKTDATGHYASGGLAVGSYKVTLVVNGAVKASILNASTQSGKSTQLNFDLTPKTTSVRTHRVWVAPDTGTHIGGGKWVDVDDNGNIVNNDNSGVSSVEKSKPPTTGSLVRTLSRPGN